MVELWPDGLARDAEEIGDHPVRAGEARGAGDIQGIPKEAIFNREPVEVRASLSHGCDDILLMPIH
jgi:hypothetical protein